MVDVDRTHVYTGNSFAAAEAPASHVWFVSLGEGHWYMGTWLYWVEGLACHMLSGVREPVRRPSRPPYVPGDETKQQIVSSRHLEPVFIHADFVAQMVRRPSWFDLHDAAAEA